MKKIVIITNHSYMLYQFRRELIQAIKKEYNVTLLMPFVGHENDFKEMGCKCIHTELDRRSINPITDLKLLKTYQQLLKQEQPDLVITYSIKPNIYASMVCKQLKIPYFVNVQGLGTAFEKPILSNIVTMMYKQALKKAKVVFFENQANANEFVKRRIIKKNQIKILQGAGVNLNYYNIEPYPKQDPIHFIFVGRIMKEKGIDEIIYTAKKMKAKYKNQVIFDLVGFFEEAYKETIEDLHKQQIIQFHGFQENVKPFIKQSHCLLLPSYHEGMANTILEASSMARPVIVSNIPGCKEGVIDNKTGYLVTVKDKEDLYQKVEQFFNLEHTKKQQMGLNARQFMEQTFDKQKVVQETIQAIKGGMMI